MMIGRQGIHHAEPLHDDKTAAIHPRPLLVALFFDHAPHLVIRRRIDMDYLDMWRGAYRTDEGNDLLAWKITTTHE